MPTPIPPATARPTEIRVPASVLQQFSAYCTMNPQKKKAFAAGLSPELFQQISAALIHFGREKLAKQLKLDYQETHPPAQ